MTSAYGEVKDGSNEREQDDDQHPDDLGITILELAFSGINNRPYPDGRWDQKDEADE